MRYGSNQHTTAPATQHTELNQYHLKFKLNNTKTI